MTPIHISQVPMPQVMLTTVDNVINWARKSSLWFLTFGIACCAIELIQVNMSRYDLERFGVIPRATPRQSDVMIVAGNINKKMVEVTRVLYEQMADPKWVIAMGACAVSGGVFQEGYNIVKGVDKVIPVDVYVPGCHPRPEALMHGFLKLQEKIETDSVRKRPVGALVSS